MHVYQIQAKHQIVFKGFVEVTDELGYNKTLFFHKRSKLDVKHSSDDRAFRGKQSLATCIVCYHSVVSY